MPDSLEFLTLRSSECYNSSQLTSSLARRSADHVLKLSPSMVKPKHELNLLRRSAPPALWVPDSPSSDELRLTEEDEQDPILTLEDVVFADLEQELKQKAQQNPEIEQEIYEKISHSVPRPFEEVKPLTIYYRPQSQNSYQTILKQNPQKILQVQFGKPRDSLSKDSLLSRDSLPDRPEITNNPFREALYLGSQTHTEVVTKSKLLTGSSGKSTAQLETGDTTKFEKKPQNSNTEKDEGLMPLTKVRTATQVELQSGQIQSRDTRPKKSRDNVCKKANEKVSRAYKQGEFNHSYSSHLQFTESTEDFWNLPELADARETISSILIEEEIIDRYGRGFYNDQVRDIPDEAGASELDPLISERTRAQKQTSPPPRPKRPQSRDRLDQKTQEYYEMVQYDLCRTVKHRAASLRPVAVSKSHGSSSLLPAMQNSASRARDKWGQEWESNPPNTKVGFSNPESVASLPPETVPNADSEQILGMLKQDNDAGKAFDTLKRLSQSEDLFVLYDNNAEFSWAEGGAPMLLDQSGALSATTDCSYQDDVGPETELFDPWSLAKHIAKVNHPEAGVEIQQAVQVPLKCPTEIVLGPLPESRLTRASTAAHMSNRDLLKSITRTSVSPFGLIPAKARETKRISPPAQVRYDALQKAQEEDLDWFDWEATEACGNSGSLKKATEDASSMSAPSKCESKRCQTLELLRHSKAYDFLPSPATTSSNAPKEPKLEDIQEILQPQMPSPVSATNLNTRIEIEPVQNPETEDETKEEPKEEVETETPLETETKATEDKIEQSLRPRLVRRSLYVCQQLGHQIGDLGDQISRKFRKNRHPSQTAEAIALRHISKRRRNRGHDLEPVMTLASIVSV